MKEIDGTEIVEITEKDGYYIKDKLEEVDYKSTTLYYPVQSIIPKLKLANKKGSESSIDKGSSQDLLDDIMSNLWDVPKKVFESN